MAVKIIEGNIFNSECQTIVNTVNCFGVMGKGIALRYRFLLPETSCEEFNSFLDRAILTDINFGFLNTLLI